MSFRIGVVGLGFGATVHVPGLQGVKGVEVVALAGNNADRARQMALKLGVPHAVCSIDELLSLELDAISLALPPRANEDAFRRALEVGLPVLSEKPVAQSADKALELAQMSHSVTTAVDYQFAELDAFIKLHQLVNRQEWGKVRHVASTWLVESWVQRNRQWSWKTDAAGNGGALSLLGSHYLYLVEWLFGPITEIACRLSTRGAFADRQGQSAVAADDTVELWATHESGTISSAFISNASPGASRHRWDVVFEKATAVLENTTTDYMSGFTLVVDGHEGQHMLISQDSIHDVDGRLAPFRRLAERFVGAVRRGEKTSPNLFHGARVQALIDCARVAHAARHFITVSKAL